MNRTGDWMQTHTGLQFWPLDPSADEVRLEDIAHALAQENRYGGHVPFPYSVAQHSVLVSLRAGEHIGGLANARAGLLHDAAEAYCKDIPRPLKRHLEGYKDIEHAIAAAIGSHFDIDLVDLPAGVLRADEEILACEQEALMPIVPAPWNLRYPAPRGIRVVEISWHQAKAGFLARAAALGIRDP